MAAFANGFGGRIFIGVTGGVVVKGTEITNKIKSQIQDIANNCEPPIKIFFIEFMKAESKIEFDEIINSHFQL